MSEFTHQAFNLCAGKDSNLRRAKPDSFTDCCN